MRLGGFDFGIVVQSIRFRPAQECNDLVLCALHRPAVA